MICGLIILSFLMPMQVQGGVFTRKPLFKPVFVGAVVDSARILGLPKLYLRDSSGNPYFAYRALLQEPAAVLYRDSDILMMSPQTKRKAYINSYVRR